MKDKKRRQPITMVAVAQLKHSDKLLSAPLDCIMPSKDIFVVHVNIINIRPDKSLQTQASAFS